jgi:hypothetical protein
MVIILLVALGVLTAVIWNELRRRRHESAVLAILTTFGAAQSDAQHDVRALLVWQPLAESARRIFPHAFGELDTATEQRFPFDKNTLERAHAKWTADWLAWEQAHDEEYRLKAAAIEREIEQVSGDAARIAKARLDHVQHEKIGRYQARYEEYIRTAKALQALIK